MLLAQSSLMLTETVSVPELIWTLFCSLGLYYTMRLCRIAVDDLKFLQDNNFNGGREYSATTSIWIFASMTINQFVYVLIGIISMMIPSPNNHIQPLTYVITAVFIMASAIKSTMAFVIDRRRVHLINMLLKENDGRKNVTPD